MIDPKYQSLKDKLLEELLSRFSQPRETLSIPYLLKGKCYSWSQKFVEAFPELTLRVGFMGHNEHYWCTLADGTIIDPTVEQFYLPEWQGPPALYRELDEEVDEVYLGKCMNCGEPIFGLKKGGRQEICPPEEGEEESQCSRDLTAYYNSEIASARRGYHD